MDKDIWGVKVGPFLVGGIEDRTPPTRQDRIWKWITWALTVLMVALANPALGVILIFGSAFVLAVMTAPDPDERTKP
jgi:hypothetical protein